MKASNVRARAAVVVAADGVRFVAAGRSRTAVLEQLAGYVAGNLVRLWPDDATTVRRLLASGKTGSAVRHYFASVASRWDAEWIEQRVAGTRRRAPSDGASGHSASSA